MFRPSDAAAGVPWYVLPALVVAQFAGTSLWFAINAIVPDLQVSLQWPAAAVGTLTAALQFGFIVGTLLFALAMIADRFDPRWVFFLSSLGGAALTIVAWLRIDHYVVLLMCRFLTGLCLAGIYPVGMKIAAQWFPKGLGHALGWLVGALVLGSASAHGLRAVTASLPWETLMIAVAVLAVAGGSLVLSLHQRVPTQHPPVALTWSAFGVMWTNRSVRRPVLGYFGHMWELYTVWVLLPFILGTRLVGEPVLWWSFAIMGSGALGCVVGGHLVAKVGGVRVATTQLGVSGLCCLLAPLMLQAPDALFYAW
ncbi:MAG: MFS transporter, partial [Burkholderiaceae bacterium]